MSNGSEVMIYLSFLLSEFIATRRARLEAREAGFLVLDIKPLRPMPYAKKIKELWSALFQPKYNKVQATYKYNQTVSNITNNFFKA